jgi:holo-[acyl-carrier protein] synthase
MSIIGIGVDIVENLRIKKLILNKNFLNRIFTIDEIKKSKKIKNKTGYFAKRFAAKEAFSKALGSGFRNGLNFKDISIYNDKKGQPFIKVNNKLKLLIKKYFETNKVNIMLSISDEKNNSIAFIVIEKNENR